jgi:hypothetical protein
MKYAKPLSIGLGLCAALLMAACGDGEGSGGDGDMTGDGDVVGDGDMPGDGDGDGDMTGSGGMTGDGDMTGSGGMNGDGDLPMLLGPEGRSELGAQIDRTGRPAISTALIETFNGDESAKNTAKDAYNAATPATSGDFAATVKTSLAILDSLDGTCGMDSQLLVGAGEDRYAALTGVLLDDQLYVNSTSGTCGVYLGAEGEFVGVLGAGDGGCGGRTPLDDVIERSYSVLAAGVLVGIDDTITGDGADHDPDTFPFLASPN